VTIAAPAACANAEDCHHEAEEHEAEGAFDLAAAAYARACTFDDGASCFARGVLLRGRIEPRDDVAAHDAFARACALRIADGCAQQATDQLTGVGTTADPDAARALLQRACSDGSSLACHNLGVLVRDGALGAHRDATAAYALFERGCQLGRGAACVEQAIALHDGAGTTRDAERATTVADRACAAAAEQCWFRAELYQQQKRYADARALHDKACGAGSGVACWNLGVMREKGLGGPKDAAGAATALSSACSLGIARACAGASTE